jgi:hypothetical protein
MKKEEKSKRKEERGKKRKREEEDLNLKKEIDNLGSSRRKS